MLPRGDPHTISGQLVRPGGLFTDNNNYSAKYEQTSRVLEIMHLDGATMCCSIMLPNTCILYRNKRTVVHQDLFIQVYFLTAAEAIRGICGHSMPVYIFNFLAGNQE
jgi:hypothetical protein